MGRSLFKSDGIQLQKFFVLSVCIILSNACGIHKKPSPTNNNPFFKAAAAELHGTLEKIPAGHEKSYGFNDRNEFKRANVGMPFSFNTWDKDSLHSNNSEMTVPVTVEGKFRALATVQKMGDSIHIVDFGAVGLATEIQKWINENKGYSFNGILRVYDKDSDFLISIKNNQLYFSALTSAQMYLNSKGLKMNNYATQKEISEVLKSTR